MTGRVLKQEVLDELAKIQGYEDWEDYNNILHIHDPLIPNAFERAVGLALAKAEAQQKEIVEIINGIDLRVGTQDMTDQELGCCIGWNEAIAEVRSLTLKKRLGVGK